MEIYNEVFSEAYTKLIGQAGGNALTSMRAELIASFQSDARADTREQMARELMMWLLREVITEDRYIKSCAFCGRYFIPQRNTKQYCSKACATKQSSHQPAGDPASVL